MCNSYIEQYLVFNSEVEIGLQSAVLLYGLVAKKDNLMNFTKNYKNLYNSLIRSTHEACIIRLHNIFDTNSKSNFNINKLFKAIIDEIELFSFDSIKKRRPNLPNNYFVKSVSLNKTLLKKYTKIKRKNQKLYNNLFKDHRNKITAHREHLTADRLDSKGMIDTKKVVCIFLDLFNIKEDLNSYYENAHPSSEMKFCELETKMVNAKNANLNDVYLLPYKEVLAISERFNNSTGK